MNKQMRELDEVAPEFVQAIRRIRATSVGLAIAVLISLGAIAGTFLRGESTRRIVTQSPCQVDPGGRKCANLRADVARAEPLQNPCISVQRTGASTPKCPRNFLKPKPAKTGHSGGTPAGVVTPTASSPTSPTPSATPPQATAPSSPPTGPDPGGHQPGQPPASPSTPSTPDPGPSSVTGPVGQTLGTVNQTVEQATGTVQQACTQVQLLAGLC